MTTAEATTTAAGASETPRRDWGRPGEIVAEYPLTLVQLAQWRQRGIGPAYFRRGRTVLYRRSDVEAWLEANMTLTGGSAA